MRTKYIEQFDRMAGPFLAALAADRLKVDMPLETKPGNSGASTYLEGLGRIVCGLTPFLFSPGGDAYELKTKQRLLDLTLGAMDNALNPAAKDYVFVQSDQALYQQNLVDIAFLGQGLLRAGNLFERLGTETQQRLIAMLKRSREIIPGENNWLLFSAMVEATLYRLTGKFEQKTVDYALNRCELWYKGDGIYGDGEHFAFDYYNSFVIHPMLLEIAETFRHLPGYEEKVAVFKRRSQRYAVILERMIAPDGSYPVTGRSIAYRCGAFQLLSMMAWRDELPEGLTAAQVRCALGAVIDRTLNAPGTYHKQFLQIGVCGHQPGLGEVYISTGSLYLAGTAFLVLGLPPDAPFWTQNNEMWTSCKVFAGFDLPCDKAMYD